MMGGEKLDKEELIKEVIAPNLPHAWIKPFHLSGAHQHNNPKKVLSALEILENDEQKYSHKPHQKNKNKAPTNTNAKNKHKNLHIDQVLHHLNKKNITLNATKSEWSKSTVHYLGFILSQGGIRPKQTEIQAILQMQPSQNKNIFVNF